MSSEGGASEGGRAGDLDRPRAGERGTPLFEDFTGDNSEAPVILFGPPAAETVVDDEVLEPEVDIL